MSASRALLVAHRAGNDLHALRVAEAAGVDLVEVDLWQWRGSLEARHSKTMGPVPLLWDRWMLAPGWTPRLHLDDVLHAARPTTELMLDLKGSSATLPDMVIASMTRLAAGRAYTVSSQAWQLLEPFAGLEGVRVVYSIGNARMLRALPRWLRGRVADGVGINQRLLTPERVTMLGELAASVFTWPVNDRVRADELVSWGVTGLISDRYELVREPSERSPAP